MTSRPASTNLFSHIRAAIENPQAPLFHLPEGATITYADMLARSARLANTLVGLGVKPGDRVAVQVEKSVDALFLYLACLRAGAVYLPLNTGYREKELDYFIEDATPQLFVCAGARADMLAPIAERHRVAHVETLDEGAGTLLDKAATAGADFDDVERSSDDLAAILYTSGTTGRSKGAMLSHGNLLSNALTLVDYWRFSHADVLLHVLPIYHTHGLFVACNTTLLSGASMIFQPQFSLPDILADLPRATVMMGVPTFYVRLLSSPDLTRDRVANMRLFTSGSAPLSPETHKDFTARTGHKILERYGMTETNMNTSNPYDGERKPGTVGFPLPGIELRLSDRETGGPVKAGEVGMIEVRGPNVFKGYWQMPEKTAEEFRDDGFFITGDLGRFDDEGYLSIVGREKDLIISGGFNVYPAEVENAIDAIEGIADVAVIGVPHPDFGEGVTAVVVASGEDAPTEQQIKDVLSADMARYKVPKKVVFLDSLPRNKMGKVQKNELRSKYRDLYDPSAHGRV